MSLSKLFKGPASEEDIVSMMHKECVKRESYSFEIVKQKITDLYEYCQHENIDGDEFMRFFFALYMAVYADRPRAKQVFHPSSIESECERKLFFEFSGYDESDKIRNKIDGRTQMIFDVGTWWHTYIQMLLWKAGILEKSEAVVRSVRKKIHGHTDGILKLTTGRCLLEIKTMNSNKFVRGKIGPYPQHEVQAGIYAKELGIDRICFIYVNKDTSEIAVHFKEVNHVKVDDMGDKMADVLDTVLHNQKPERVCCEEPTDDMATKCVFKTLCFSTRK